MFHSTACRRSAEEDDGAEGDMLDQRADIEDGILTHAELEERPRKRARVPGKVDIADKVRYAPFIGVFPLLLLSRPDCAYYLFLMPSTAPSRLLWTAHHSSRTDRCTEELETCIDPQDGGGDPAIQGCVSVQGGQLRCRSKAGQDFIFPVEHISVRVEDYTCTGWFTIQLWSESEGGLLRCTIIHRNGYSCHSSSCVRSELTIYMYMQYLLTRFKL